MSTVAFFDSLKAELKPYATVIVGEMLLHLRCNTWKKQPRIVPIAI